MDENLYSQTYSQIISKALNGNANFQMIAAPIVFAFPVVPIGQITPRAYQIASRIPPWSPVGSFNTGDTAFADAYRQVLTHVTFTLSPGQQNDYNNLQNQVTQASNAITTAQSNMNAAYLAQQQNGGVIFQNQYPTVTAWLAGPGAAYQEDIDNKTAAYRVVSQKLLELQQNAMPPTLQNAVDALHLPSGNPSTTPSPRGWVKVADGSGILQWQPEWIIGTTGQDWRASLSAGSVGAFSVEIDASDNTKNFQKSFASANASIDQPFWSVNVGGSWSKMDLTTNDKSVEATISVESSTLVPISPGAWYDGGFLRQLQTAGRKLAELIRAPAG